MDTAKCTLDGVDYQAVRFRDLPPAEFAKKKLHLICLGCRAQAYFRKASKSGQAACFYARPHEDDCKLAASQYGQNDTGPGDDQDILHNSGRRIILDLNFGSHNDKHNNPDADIPNPSGRGGRFVGSGARPDAARHKRLGPILRDLIEYPQFRASKEILEIGGRGNFVIADLFIQSGAVTRSHEGQYHGYWGKVVSTGRREADDSLWLNMGGRSNMSIRVSNRFISGLLENSHVSDEKELHGRYALVLGNLKVSLSTGKLYVEVDELGFIALR